MEYNGHPCQCNTAVAHTHLPNNVTALDIECPLCSVYLATLYIDEIAWPIVTGANTPMMGIYQLINNTGFFSDNAAALNRLIDSHSDLHVD